VSDHTGPQDPGVASADTTRPGASPTLSGSWPRIAMLAFLGLLAMIAGIHVAARTT